MAKATKCTKKPIKFSNARSKKAFEELPKEVCQIFSGELEDVIAHGLGPTIRFSPLFDKVVELKQNGRPAYRCAYKVLDDCVVVLHSFKKTSQGPDKKNMQTVETRLKSLDPQQFC